MIRAVNTSLPEGDESGVVTVAPAPEKARRDKSYLTGETISTLRGSGGWGTWWPATSREPVWRSARDWVAIGGVVAFCLIFLVLAAAIHFGV